MGISVKAESLTKKFGRFTAVDNVSFEVNKGEIFGFLGANGAGKTTTIRMLCGLLVPTSGDAIVAGFSVKKEPEQVKRRLGYMSQKFSLYNFMTVAENIEFYAGIYGVDGKRIPSRIEELSEILELTEMKERPVSDIPGGAKQRTALACAISHEPEILFLDEPTAGVDPVLRRRFWKIIENLSSKGTTVFVTTHYMDEVENCGRVALMNNGRILVEGGLHEIKAAAFDKPVYEIETSDIVKAFSVVSEKQSVIGEVSVHGAVLHIVPYSGPEETMNAVAKILDKAGIKYSEFRQVQPTMDDVFVKLVRR